MVQQQQQLINYISFFVAVDEGYEKNSSYQKMQYNIKSFTTLTIDKYSRAVV